MQERVEVKAARIPDRDRLLETLKSQGLDARPVDEVGIEVSCSGDADEVTDRVLAHVEGVVLDLGATFVPVKHEGVVYLRPPTD